jgi:hypothetical protein
LKRFSRKISLINLFKVVLKSQWQEKGEIKFEKEVV